MALGCARANFVDVMIPAADIGERHFNSHIRLDQPRDLPQALTECAARIIGPRLIRLLLDRLQKLHGVKCLAAGPVENFVRRARVHGLKHFRRAFIAHLKTVQTLDGDGVVATAHGARQYGSHGHGANRRERLRRGRQRAIEPTVIGSLTAGRPGFHVVLRIEMRTRGIGRTRRVHDGEMLRGVERLERSQRRVQAEEAIEIDRGVLRIGAGRARNGDRRPHAVIARLGVRHDNVQAVGSAALENHHQNFLARGRSICRIERALEPQGRAAHANHSETGVPQKDSSSRHERHLL